MFSSKPIAAAFSVAILFCSVATDGARADPPGPLWERHPGSVGADTVRGVATDLVGNVIVVGGTTGSIGKRNAGKQDTFIIRYSPGGGVLWRRQVGSTNIDLPTGVAVDGSGNITVVGYTTGWLFGRAAGGTDGFVVSYTPDGTIRWKKRFATASDDFANSVAAETAGSVVVAASEGSSRLLVKYSSDGIEVWRRVLPVYFLSPNAVAITPSGQIIVGGYTHASLNGQNQGGADAVIAMYSSAGDAQWLRQFGTAADDYVSRIAVAADGAIYVSGTKMDDLQEVVLTAFSPAGEPRWKRMLGGDYSDYGWGVAVNMAGDVVLTGDKFGQPFAASFTSGGTPRWTRSLPTYPTSPVYAAVDPAGDLLLAGTIYTSAARGHLDGYLAKFSD